MKAFLRLILALTFLVLSGWVLFRGFSENGSGGGDGAIKVENGRTNSGRERKTLNMSAGDQGFLVDRLPHRTHIGPAGELEPVRALSERTVLAISAGVEIPSDTPVLPDPRKMRGFRLRSEDSQDVRPLGLSMLTRQIETHGQHGGSLRGIVNLIRSASANGLSQADSESALDFVERGCPDVMDAGSYLWICDELLTAVRCSSYSRERIVERLKQLAENTGADPNLRDYAVQHLGHLHESGVMVADIETILCEQASSSLEGPAPGSAFLALNHAVELGGFQGDHEALGLLALEVSMDETRPDVVRVSAMPLAASLGGDAAIERMSSLVSKDDTSPLLLRSARHTLAHFSK